MEVDFVKRASELITEAGKKDVILRVMGAVAFKIHCTKYKKLYGALDRKVTDIDCLGYSKQQDAIKKLLINMGYIETPPSLARTLSSLGTRQIYYDSTNMFKIDVFLDQLRMCHVIDFRNRLEIDCPTIPLAELFLEKMQIVNLTEKDVKDAIVLLREHNIGEEDKETINAKYIAKLLSDDWGFYYTVNMNLEKIRNLLAGFDVFAREDRTDVTSKIDKITSIIEKEPKTFGWKMRSKIGSKRKWYKYVDMPT